MKDEELDSPPVVCFSILLFDRWDILACIDKEEAMLCISMITDLPEYKKRTSGMTSALFKPSPQAQLSAPPMIEPGVYTLTDATWSMAMDLSGKDGKSLISYTKHSLDNQMVSPNFAFGIVRHFRDVYSRLIWPQWQIIPLGAGYCIRNVKSGLYVTVDNSLQEDTTLVTTKYPVSWDIIVKGGITQRSEDGITVVSVWRSFIVQTHSMLTSVVYLSEYLVSSGPRATYL